MYVHAVLKVGRAGEINARQCAAGSLGNRQAYSLSRQPLRLSEHGFKPFFNERRKRPAFFGRLFLGPAQEIAGKSNGSPPHMSKHTGETSICQRCLQDGRRCSHGAVSPCCLGNNNARAPRHREATTTSRFACDTRATTAVAAAVLAHLRVKREDRFVTLGTSHRGK